MPALPFPTPTLLLYSIPIAAFLIYAPLGVVAAERAKLGVDALRTPRAVTEKLPAYAQRAFWAHQNGFESFMVFAAAALMAYVTGVESSAAGWAAVLYVIARGIYPVFYIANILIGRSLMFGIASFSVLTLFLQSLATLKSGIG